MGLVSGSITSLVNGVSQQPDWMRLPSQGTIQENAMSSLVQGMTRRPPTEHIARVSPTTFGDAFLHTINRDSSHQYSVVLTNGNLRVFDMADGSEKTVAFPSGKAYLNSASPSTMFACTTIADFTFVMNKDVTVTETNAGNIVDNSMFVYVKQGFYNCNYAVFIDNVQQALLTTAATGAASQTDTIAGTLYTQLVSALGAGWTLNNFGSVIQIKKNDNSVHDIKAIDSQGNTAMFAFARSIQNFTDLPPFAYNGTIVEVRGASSNAFDAYWVKFFGSDNTWKETVKPEDEARPTPSTMPWKLTQEVDGTFTFDVIDWGWRAAGDATTNPSPSLIGRKINDIYIHRNRLFLLADQNFVASRIGGDHYFELYAATSTTTLDTDPLDVGLSSTSDTVPIARHAVSFADDLMIFTDPGQFRVGGGDILTSQTVKATLTAGYAARLRAKPVTNGKLIHFAIEKGADSGVREGFIDSNSQVFDAPDITVHVPTYISGAVTRLCSAINFDALFVLADGAPNKVYVYKWFIENNQKLQSSWSQWVFPSGDTVLSISYITGSIYMLIARSTGVFLERVRLDESYKDTGLDFSVRLDRKCSATGVYDAANNWTTWTLPYDLTGLSPVGAFGSAFEAPGFQLPELTISNAAAGVVKVTGADLSAGPCFFGVRYTQTYRLSQVFLAAQGQGGAGGSRAAITDGRLQLRTLYFNHDTTGYFQVTVTSLGRSPYVYHYSPNDIGQMQLGVVDLSPGRFRVPVRAENTKVTIDITSDSHFPCSILSFDWEGEFTMRSRRTT